MNAPLPPHAPQPSRRLAGRTALVFGAGSSGEGWSNGQAAALAYARAGADLVLVDIVAGRAEATARLCADAGARVHPLCGSVLDEVLVEDAVAQTVAAFGSIDILHNNAGLAEVAPTVAMTSDTWMRALDINVTAAFRTCRAGLRRMLAQPRGGIITNVSSVAGLRYPGIAYVGYAAAKAALNQLTVSIALEHATRGIRANAIVPGVLDTPLVRNQLGARFGTDEAAARREREAMCPMGFMGDAWDVANAAVFLASDEARYITGHLLVVDGGLTARCA